MNNSYDQRLFASYDRRIAGLDPAEAMKQEWFNAYADANYKEVVSGILSRNSQAKVLEIGCNRGHLLAWLHGCGVSVLHGIDLSPGDIDYAGRLVPEANIQLADAFLFLPTCPRSFDLIIMKAVFEHIPKQRSIELLELLAASLCNDGVAVIDVPNMDWFMACHERYMDFTHQVGFTRESLAQVMNETFTQVEVLPASQPRRYGMRAFLVRVLRRSFVGCISIMLRILGNDAQALWWNYRSIVGVAYGPRQSGSRR